MEDQTQFLHQMLRGNADAVDLVEALAGVSQVLDDLIDKDVEPSPHDIVAAFWDALVTVPSNPFYQRHVATLQPLIRQTLLDWLAANVLERGDRQAQTLAFVLRDSLTGIVHYCALLVGGLEWAIEVGPSIRMYFHDDGLEDYLSEREKTQEGRGDG